MENDQQGHKEAKDQVLDIVELEEHAKFKGTKAPEAKQYAFRVDKDRVVVNTPILNGRAILAAVNKTPEEFKLYVHKRGNQPVPVGPDQDVDLRDPGLERFTTMPKDTTEGREGPCLRQDFRLPEADELYLNGTGLNWEARLDGTSRWVILHAWQVPTGYNHETISLAVLIPDNYSDSQIDMVYFRPHLARADGRSIGALADQSIGTEIWQRWSRHRTGANPWRKGVDDIASHLALVDEWLRREFEKKQ